MVESKMAERDEKKNDNERERQKEDEIMATVTEYISTQNSIKQGFEKFGNKAEDAQKRH